MITIQHPITGETIQIAGTVGNVKAVAGQYYIRINNDLFELENEGKWVCQVENAHGQFELMGDSGIYETREEAEVEADEWREVGGVINNVRVTQIVAEWGTMAVKR